MFISCLYSFDHKKIYSYIGKRKKIMLSAARFEVHKIHPILLDSDILNSIHFYAYKLPNTYSVSLCN